jgi:hypothetical protein
MAFLTSAICFLTAAYGCFSQKVGEREREQELRTGFNHCKCSEKLPPAASRLNANHYETRAYKQFMTAQLSHIKRVFTEVLGETVLPFASRGTWATPFQKQDHLSVQSDVLFQPQFGGCARVVPHEYHKPFPVISAATVVSPTRCAALRHVFCNLCSML